MSLKVFPGLLVTVILAIVAIWLADYVSLSETLIAILLGFVAGNLFSLPKSWHSGISWSECHGLSVAVALLGAQLNLWVLGQLNWLTVVLLISGLLVTFGVSWLVAGWLGMSRQMALLVGSGQGICGTAAVMATQRVIKAPAAEAALVVAWINFLGFVGIFLLPGLLNLWFPGDTELAGHLIGNTLQSMGHVVAAGFGLDEPSGQLAVLVKMGRILMLIPVLLLLVIWQRRATQGAGADLQQPAYGRLIPWFIWVFVLLSVVSSLGWLPAELQALLTQVGDFLFIMAMAAIGLGIRLKVIWHQGTRLMFLGLVVFVVQLVWSLLLLINLQ